MSILHENGFRHLRRWSLQSMYLHQMQLLLPRNWRLPWNAPSKKSTDSFSLFLVIRVLSDLGSPAQLSSMDRTVYWNIEDKCEANSRLARHLRVYESEFTKHLHDRQIPLTNNNSEQTLRTAVRFERLVVVTDQERELRRSKTGSSGNLVGRCVNWAFSVIFRHERNNDKTLSLIARIGSKLEGEFGRLSTGE